MSAPNSVRPVSVLPSGRPSMIPSRTNPPGARPGIHRSAARPGRAALAGAALALAALAGCGKKQAQSGPPAPVEVGVVTLAPTPVTLTKELSGRTSAFRVAEVRARVNGIVQKRLFTEGSDVRQGQVLFVIDPAPYQAALDGAKAALARAEANVANTRLQAERYADLVKDNAVSRQEYDNAMAALKSGEADVAAARAAEQAARINLGYTTVS